MIAGRQPTSTKSPSLHHSLSLSPSFDFHPLSGFLTLCGFPSSFLNLFGLTISRFFHFLLFLYIFNNKKLHYAEKESGARLLNNFFSIVIVY